MSRLALARSYVRRARRARRRPDPIGLPELVRSFPAWLQSQDRVSLADGRPWLTFEATRLIAGHLTPTSRVFEFGSGGSTLFFARRAGSVVSVENDAAWYGVVRQALASMDNVELVLEPGVDVADASDAPDVRFGSRSELFHHQTFERYVRTIERFPDESFDVLIVDGRARPAAFILGHPKVRVGGLIVLDDASRSGYAAVVEAATRAGWPASGSYGPKPYSADFAQTMVWVKTSRIDAGLELLSPA